MTSRGRSAAVTLIAPIVFLPAVLFLSRGFGSAESPGAAVSALRTLPVGRTLGFTCLQAGLSAISAIVVAMPGAFMLGRIEFPGRRLVASLATVPFVLPSIVVVLAMIGFYGGNGAVAAVIGDRPFHLYGLGGVVVGHVYYNVSIALRMIGDAWSRIGEEYHEIAIISGARRDQYFARVVAPLLFPSILGAFVLVFVFSFLSFGIVLVFGGIRFSTIEVRIFQELYTYGDRVSAAWYALVQLLFSGAFFLGFSTVLPRIRASGEAVHQRRRSFGELAPLERTLLLGYGLVALVLTVGPVASLVPRAVGDGFRALVGAAPAGRNLVDVVGRSLSGLIAESVTIAVAAGSLCFVGAYALARIRRGSVVSALAHLPLGVSVVSFAAGLRLVAEGVSGYVLLVLVDAFIAFPVVYRVLEGAVAELPASYLDAGRVDGAGPLQLVLRVEMPLLRSAMATAAAYALAVPLADFTGVMTIGRGRIVTFPVAVYRMLGFRNFGATVALGICFVLILLVLFAVIETRSGEGRSAPI